jgi:hypothetical protein
MMGLLRLLAIVPSTANLLVFNAGQCDPGHS